MSRCQLVYVMCALAVLSTASHGGIDDHVAGWSFNEGTGNVTWDDSGLSWGDISGATWTEGMSGTGLHFDGLDDFVALTDGEGLPDHLTSLSEGSIAMWIRFDDDAQANVIHSMFYLGRDGNSGNDGAFHVEVGHFQVNNKLYWTVTEPEHQQPTLCYDSSWHLQADTWYHYVLVVSESGNTGYINGEEMTDRHYNFGSPDDRKFLADISNQEACWFGRGFFASSDQFLHGTLDEVRFWDRPLLAGEVQAYFESFGYEPPDPPEQPSISIITPEEGDRVEGLVTISGTTTDIHGGNIRLWFGKGQPVTLPSQPTWSHTWDSTTAEEGPLTIRARARECSSCPIHAHEIEVEVDNVPPAITIDTLADGDFAWGEVSVTGSTTQGGVVTVRIDDGPPITATGTNPWSVELDLADAAIGAHTLRAVLSAGGNDIDSAEVVFITAPESPPAVDCGTTHWGDRLDAINSASPDWVNTCGDVCWPTVTFHIIGHSENIGLAGHLEEVFAEEPIDGRSWIFVEHAIGGEETWEWITPGTEGYQAIQSILDVADGADDAPHLALVLTSNLMTWPSGGDDDSDANYERFRSDVETLVAMLDDGGQGVLMTYLSAHRMKPAQPMAAWYENVAINDVISRAESDGFPRLKPGPDLHGPSWCDFPDGYDMDMAHPDADGLQSMARAWHAILLEDIRHPGDVNGDGAVSTTDLLMVLDAWGPCDGCAADVTGDGQVNVNDVLMLISYWT